jgi:hypothetical protein
MLLFAVSAVDKLRQVPLKNLAIFVLVIVALIVAIFLIRKAAGMNRIFLVLIGGTIMAVLLMTWTYQRNEPKFLSPLVDKIAPFFPSAPKPLSGRPEAGDPSGAKKPAEQPSKDQPQPPKGQPPPPPRSKVY